MGRWAMPFMLALAVGCIAPLMPPEEFPEDPIAFVHWTRKAASKRTSILEKADDPAAPARGVGDSDQAREGERRAYLAGEVSLAIQQKLAKYPGRLSLVWPRTGEIEPVEAAPVGSIPLAWSSDHQRLLFATDHRGGKEQLYEYHVGRKELRRITMGPDEHPRGDYASDGGFLVLRVQDSGGSGPSQTTVHRADPAGRLGPPIAYDVPRGTLRLTSDGSRMVYEQVRTRKRRAGPSILESTIAVRSLEAGAPEEMLLRGREPALSPDGHWIVFASKSSAGYRLRRMRPDGTARVPIGPGGTEERMPSVSPDGEYVVFVQMSQGKRTLVVRRFDGKGERNLVSKGSSEFPVW